MRDLRAPNLESLLGSLEMDQRDRRIKIDGKTGIATKQYGAKKNTTFLRDHTPWSHNKMSGNKNG